MSYFVRLLSYCLLRSLSLGNRFSSSAETNELLRAFIELLPAGIALPWESLLMYAQRLMSYFVRLQASN